jgi:hypothetical protein
VSRKRAEANKAKNKPQAKVAQAEDVPTAQIAKLDINYDSDASAFISAAVPTIKSVPGNFVIDSGASHHMVMSSTLLSDVKQTTPVSIKIEDGTKLLSRSSGSLILGPIKFTMSDSQMRFMMKKKSRVELDDYKITTESERSGSNWEQACRQYFRHSPTSSSSLFTMTRKGITYQRRHERADLH